VNNTKLVVTKDTHVQSFIFVLWMYHF